MDANIIWMKEMNLTLFISANKRKYLWLFMVLIIVSLSTSVYSKVEFVFEVNLTEPEGAVEVKNILISKGTKVLEDPIDVDHKWWKSNIVKAIKKMTEIPEVFNPDGEEKGDLGYIGEKRLLKNLPLKLFVAIVTLNDVDLIVSGRPEEENIKECQSIIKLNRYWGNPEVKLPVKLKTVESWAQELSLNCSNGCLAINANHFKYNKFRLGKEEKDWTKADGCGEFIGVVKSEGKYHWPPIATQKEVNASPLDQLGYSGKGPKWTLESWKENVMSKRYVINIPEDKENPNLLFSEKLDNQENLSSSVLGFSEHKNLASLTEKPQNVDSLHNLYNAVAGSLLIKNKIPAKTDQTGTNSDKNNARTAVGIINNNMLIIVGWQGEKAGKKTIPSRGVKLKTLARFFELLDVSNVVNLDGSGSTSMIYNGVSLIETSDFESELRPVINILGFKPKTAGAKK